MNILKGIIFNPLSDEKMDIFNPGYLVVSSQGLIEGCFRKNPKANFQKAKMINFGTKIILPGFVDTHVHLPQYAFAGIGNLALLPWLRKYTFPREKVFKNSEIARQGSAVFFDDLAKNGTTTALVYCTIHRQATDIAFQSALQKGLRVIMGKVMMDQNAPRGLLEKTNTSLQESEELIQKWHGRDEGRLQYALAPRFAITCSKALMKGVSVLRKQYDVYIQTHLAENKEEIVYVSKLFPKAKHYTDVYESLGLLGKKTIMAHCIYLETDERQLLKKTETKIAHCPTSNRFLQSGVMPYRTWQKEGLTIGLGTDVAGGYSLSLFNEMKEAIETSKTHNMFNSHNKQDIISPSEALYLATLGGAKVLGLEDKIGNFVSGKEADFLIVDSSIADPFRGKSPYQSPLEILSRLLYRGEPNAIVEVFVRGKSIYKRSTLF